MMATLIEWVFGKCETAEEPCDPLRELVETARESEREAWEAVNMSRRRRGKSPLDAERERADPARSLRRALAEREEAT